MPHFELCYKFPEDLDTTDIAEAKYHEKMTALAKKIQIQVSKLFFGWDVSFEVSELGYTEGVSDITVTGWVTDNKDEMIDTAIETQATILDLLEKNTYEDQTVECWWQRVKGKWGSSQGKRFLPPTY